MQSITTTTALQPVPAESEIDAFVRLATAASSRDGYQADFGYFSAWCETQGVADMPASPQNAARYLAHCARQKLRPATIARRAAAIRYVHQLARQPTPTDSTEVRLVLKGIRRDPSRLPPVAPGGHDRASGAPASGDLPGRHEGQAGQGAAGYRIRWRPAA